MVEVCGRGGGGDDEVDVAVVELIDERDEAASFVFAVGIEDRDAGDDDGLVFASDFDVVVLTAGAGADGEEIEPDGAVALADDGDGTAFDFDRAAGGTAVVGQLGKESFEALRCVRGGGQEVGSGLSELAEAVVGGAVDVQDFDVLLDQLDGR